MVSKKVLVSGRVQGIGFREAIREYAESHDLKGYARNLPDRRVEVVFQGDPDRVDAAVEFVSKGAGYTKVEDAFSAPVPEQVYAGFEIL